MSCFCDGDWLLHGPLYHPRLQVSQPNLNISSGKDYALAMQNKSMAVPGVNSSLALPEEGAGAFFGGDFSSTDEISTGMVSMKTVHSTNVTVSSNLLRFSLSADNSSSSGSASSRRRRHRRLAKSRSRKATRITLQSNQRLDMTQSEVVTLSCGWDQYGRVTTSCSTGQRFNLSCNGTAVQQAFECRSQQDTQCAVWNGAVWDSSTCVTESTESFETTCKCYDVAAFGSDDGSAMNVVLDFASVTTVVFDDFMATIKTAALLDPYVILRNVSGDPSIRMS
jgi:hypothetical protein